MYLCVCACVCVCVCFEGKVWKGRMTEKETERKVAMKSRCHPFSSLHSHTHAHRHTHTRTPHISSRSTTKRKDIRQDFNVLRLSTLACASLPTTFNQPSATAAPVTSSSVHHLVPSPIQSKEKCGKIKVCYRSELNLHHSPDAGLPLCRRPLHCRSPLPMPLPSPAASVEEARVGADLVAQVAKFAGAREAHEKRFRFLGRDAALLDSAEAAQRRAKEGRQGRTRVRLRPRCHAAPAPFSRPLGVTHQGACVAQ